MRLEYTLTLADYQAAQYLHWHQTPARRFIHFFVYDGIPILTAATGCVVAKRLGLFGLRIPYWLEFTSSASIAALYLKVTAKGRKAKRYKKYYDRQFPPEKRTSWIEIDDSGVSSAIVGTDAESFEWTRIVGFAQDDNMTLLYLTKKQFLLFPSPAQNSSERAELADLITRYFGGRTQC